MHILAVALGLIVMGLAAISGSLYLSAISPWNVLIRDLGIAAVAGGAVSWATELLLVRELQKRIREQFEPVEQGLKTNAGELDELISRGLPLIRVAQHSCLSLLLPPRSVRQVMQPAVDFAPETTKGLIAEELGASPGPNHIVRIAGRSARDFLLDHGAFYRTLNDQLAGDDEVHYKILIANPYSWEGERICRAEGTAPIAQLKAEVPACLARIRGWQQLDKKRFKIEAKVYSCGVYSWLVATKNCVFVEQYHFGHWPSAPGCNGGLLPMQQYRKERSPNELQAYSMLISHFDFLWNSPESKAINSLIQPEADLAVVTEALKDLGERTCNLTSLKELALR